MDYRDTIHLPKTAFGMKANLAQREPEHLKRWKEIDLYEQIKNSHSNRQSFILHDGPPYANGHLHMGHALNKILKDVVNRSQFMMGKKIHYVPGWDCHGLPIEWEIESKYRKAKKNKDDVPIVEFRKECRNFAAQWIGTQKEEFQRLGIIGDWSNPYTTMNYKAEAQIYRELLKFLMNGSLYCGLKPVLWSTIEKTALAEAEIEYKDHVSDSIYVRFPILKSTHPLLTDNTDILIWTTTPWTLPGNRAVAYGEDIAYVVMEVKDVTDESSLTKGDRIVLAQDFVEKVKEIAGIENWETLGTIDDFGDTVCAHPLRAQGYDFDVPVHPGEFVTNEQGTGFVHIGPGHGEDDFKFARKHNIEIPRTVDDSGRFYESVPLFAGKAILFQDGKKGDANKSVMEALSNVNKLVAHDKMTHSYPHSWRSKAPLIYRTTEQWFVNINHDNLREKALKAIQETRFVPEQGRSRLNAMIENRPDWCLSRQRVWGVPIAIFVHKETGEPLKDEDVCERVAKAFEEHGSDVWFEKDPKEFLKDKYNPDDFEVVKDILDVWFDSGATHSYVLENREDLEWPADLYLEGSDQHRGWFHHALLESTATRGRAPFNAILTHGFVVDEKGYKMSKSVGNVISPKQIIQKYGADIIRLWVMASDYSEDLRVGEAILKHQTDAYRRFRNTLRFILGNLNQFDKAKEYVDYDSLPELEKWVCHRLHEIDAQIREDVNNFKFHHIYTIVHNFCAVDLSALYFDIRKDCLYCDHPESLKRRAARTTLDLIFNYLIRWLAPMLCFTAEEAWQLYRSDNDEQSVHLLTFLTPDSRWLNEDLGQKWQKIRDLRRVITGAIEVDRAEQKIGSSLQAHPKVYLSHDWIEALDGVDLAEISIVSALTLIEKDIPEDAFQLSDVENVGVIIVPAQGDKCERCWVISPEVGDGPKWKDLCHRCVDAVEKTLETKVA